MDDPKKSLKSIISASENILKYFRVRASWVLQKFLKKISWQFQYISDPFVTLLQILFLRNTISDNSMTIPNWCLA